MTFHDIQYAFPPAGYLIPLVIFVLGLFLFLKQERRRTLRKYASPGLLEKLMIRRSDLLFWSKAVACCLIWGLSSLALMQPRGYGDYPEENKIRKKAEDGIKQQPYHEVILAIDASSSMKIKDARDGKSRFDFSKDITDAIITKLKGEPVSLQAFTSEVVQISPLTTDYLFVRLMLRKMQINEGGDAGTDFAKTLKTIREQFLQEHPKVLKSLVILSDGGDTELETAPEGDRSRVRDNILKELDDAEKLNFRVFTVGIGSKEGSSVPDVIFEGKAVRSALDEELLLQMSAKGKGRYFFANQYTPIELATKLSDEFNGTPQLASSNIANAAGEELIHILYFQIPLGLAILLLIASMSLPDTWMRNSKHLMAQEKEFLTG